MTWVLALAVRPFAAFLLLALFGVPARLAVQRYMRDGRLKRLLLRRIELKKPPKRWQA